jgi:alkylation response protein AidB-like acyl-CoA dehydrogenase
MSGIDIINTARTFAHDVIEPHAQSWENEKKQPVDALRQAAKLGLMAIDTPVSFGGRGETFTTKLAICELMSRADMGFTFSMINSQNVAAKLATQPESQYQSLVSQLMGAELFGATALSEPGAGSDFSGIKTSAVRTGNTWRLNGTKGWITNACIADIFVVYAQAEPASGSRGIASFLVDARNPGFTRGSPYELMGGHAIGAGEFYLENFEVDESHLLAAPGEGFKHALGTVNNARVYVASMCAGLIADALKRALVYGESRQAFGAPILNNQGLMWTLADVATKLEALRALCEKAGVLIDNNEDAIMSAAFAKKFAGDVTASSVIACQQAMGANGLRLDHPLSRHLACAKIASYADGSTEMMNERISVGLRRAQDLVPNNDM